MHVRVASARSVVLRTETLIRGEVGAVWAVLADVDQYASWNPWLVKAEGELREGGVVWAHALLGGKRPMRVKHRVLAVEPGRRLVWCDAGWSSVLVYGQRTRRLTPAGDGAVQLEQELLLEGPFRGLAGRMYGGAMQSGMEAETEAVKRRVEARG